MRSDSLIGHEAVPGTMGSFEDLAGRVNEAAAAGGKFADSLVRVAGAAVSGVLVFLDREMAYAQKAMKKSATERTGQTKGVSHK